MFAAACLGFMVTFQAVPQEPRQPPRDEPAARRPAEESKSKQQSDADADITRAAARLIEADSYRFRVTAERAEGEPRSLILDGRFQAGQPLLLKSERLELLAFRGDKRVAYRTDEDAEWRRLPLSTELFGGEGRRRIGNEGRREGETARSEPERRPQDRRPDEARPEERRPEDRRPDEGRPEERRPEGRRPDETGAERERVAKAAEREQGLRGDREALTIVGLVPAPHDLVRTLLTGLAETTRHVEKGGFFDKDKIVYESRLTPQGDELCRDHFAPILPARDVDGGPLACIVRVIGDQEGDVNRLQLEIRRPGAEQPVALRLDYEIDKIGRTEVEVPEEARRRLQE